jgi:hypothetical protein
MQLYALFSNYCGKAPIIKTGPLTKELEKFLVQYILILTRYRVLLNWGIFFTRTGKNEFPKT